MSEIDYLKLMREIIDFGEVRPDRTGVGTRSLFGPQLRFDLRQGFPLLRTKKVATKAMTGELLWMLAGDTNARTLQEQGIKIWDEWADEKTGHLGPIYGAQWREWTGFDYEEDMPVVIDQIAELIHGLETEPWSRRHIVSAWNATDIDQMALAPCHTMFQLYVHRPRHEDHKPEISLKLYQRSADMFLGVPFNIASYSLLLHMIAKQVDMKPRYFIHSFGDAHIYENHIPMVLEQLSRPVRGNLPTLRLADGVDSIFKYKMEHIEFENYNPQPAIKAPVAV